jgi:uncharacterized protein (TIRG00374 family)
MERKKILSLSLALGISGIALFFALRDVSLPHLGHVLWKGHYGWLLPATILLLVIYGLRAFFWRQTLSVTRVVPLFHLYSSVVVGYMANNILPFRGGEMVRALYTRKIEHLPLPVLLSTIFIERLFDLVSLSLVLFLFLTTAGQPVGSKSLWLIGGTFALFLGLYALVRGRGKILGFLDRSLLPLVQGHRLAVRILKLLEQVLHGFSSLTSPLLLLRLFLTSLLIWSLTLVFTWLCLLMFDITAHPVEMTLAFLVFTNLALLIPSSPGGIGVIQLAAVYALAPYHVPADRAIALSLVGQALSIALTGVLGYYFITRSHLSLAQMRHQAMEITEGRVRAEETIPGPAGDPGGKQ